MNIEQFIRQPATRREFLSRSGTGLGSLGLASLLATDARGEAIAPAALTGGLSPMMSKPAQYPATAKPVIHIF